MGETDVAGSGARPRLRDIFMGFLGLGLTSFGGALPLARQSLVTRRKWLTDEEFVELLGLCQFLPGGNVVNLSVAVGMRFHGPFGGLIGILGLMAGPTAVVVGLGVLYERFSDDPQVRSLFAGLAAAAAGLMVSMALKMMKPLRGRPLAIGVALLAFLALAVIQLPLLWVMLILVPVSVGLAAWRGL